MKRSQLTLLSLIILFATACGQPGPLYLPKEDPPTQVEPNTKIEPSKDLQAPPEKAEPESETKTDKNQ